MTYFRSQWRVQTNLWCTVCKRRDLRYKGGLVIKNLKMSTILYISRTISFKYATTGLQDYCIALLSLWCVWVSLLFHPINFSWSICHKMEFWASFIPCLQFNKNITYCLWTDYIWWVVDACLNSYTSILHFMASALFRCIELLDII